MPYVIFHILGDYILKERWATSIDALVAALDSIEEASHLGLTGFGLSGGVHYDIVNLETGKSELYVDNWGFCPANQDYSDYIRRWGIK